jgi:hypothetical protein
MTISFSKRIQFHGACWIDGWMDGWPKRHNSYKLSLIRKHAEPSRKTYMKHRCGLVAPRYDTRTTISNEVFTEAESSTTGTHAENRLKYSSSPPTPSPGDCKLITGRGTLIKFSMDDLSNVLTTLNAMLTLHGRGYQTRTNKKRN